MSEHEPITVAVLNDYQVVVAGVRKMLEPYADRVVVVEVEAGRPVERDVDVALYDTFAKPLGDGLDHAARLSGHRAERMVVYSWQHDAQALDRLRADGVAGFVHKQAGAAELVEVLQRVHAGEQVFPPRTAQGRTDGEDGTGGSEGAGWPGREEGLSARESEVVALIVQGLSNVEVGQQAFLSVNTIKSYIRSAYRKMGVRSRSQAVLWGIDHGFRREPAHEPLHDPSGEQV